MALIPAHVTQTGGVLPALLPQPDDHQPVSEICPWCDGVGYDSDSEMSWGSDCGRCGGSGSIGTITNGEHRRRTFDDRVFYLDASRADLMDRDCCPSCGLGGGHDEGGCPNSTKITYIDGKPFIEGE